MKNQKTTTENLAIGQIYKVTYPASKTTKVGFLKAEENGTLKFETIKGTSFTSKQESIELLAIDKELGIAMQEVCMLTKPEYLIKTTTGDLFKYEEMRDYITKTTKLPEEILEEKAEPSKSKVDVKAIVEKHEAKKKSSKKEDAVVPASDEISFEKPEPKAESKKPEPKVSKKESAKEESPKADLSADELFFEKAKSVNTLEEFNSITEEFKISLINKNHGIVKFTEVRKSRVNPSLLSIIFEMEDGLTGGCQLVRLKRYFKIA